MSDDLTMLAGELRAMRERLERLERLETPRSEAGAWTPALAFAGGGSATYDARSGYYVRIGRAIIWHALIDVATVSSPSGAVSVTGFPFTPSQRCGGFATQYDQINLSTGYTGISALMMPSLGATALLRENGDSVFSQSLQGAMVVGTSMIELTGIAFA